MKKQLLSIVIILAMILNLLVLPVFAEGTLTLSVPDVEAKAGEEVKVTVNVSNNTGLASLKVNVNYDSVLTLMGVEFNSAFGSMVTAPEPFANPEPLTMISPLSDVSANGVFATLTFKVAENAQNGYKANITLIYDEDDIYDGNYDNVATNVVNGSVTVIADEENVGTAEIVGATLDIGASLTINYCVKGTDIENAKMKFTSSSGRVTEVKGTFDEKEDLYKYAYEGINPQCMSDVIKAELICGNQVIAVKENYCVKDYCENQAGKTASQLKLTNGQYEAFKTLMADMLAYGSAAQKYRKYNTENLSDTSEWIDAYKSTFNTPTGVKRISGNTDSENKVKSVGLNMANVNRIYFKLILNDESVVVTLNDQIIDVSALAKNNDGTYMLYSPDVFATGFSDVYTLKLTKSGEVISTVEYNVNAYIEAKYETNGLSEILKSLSNYGNAAKAYQNVSTDGDFDLDEDEI